MIGIFFVSWFFFLLSLSSGIHVGAHILNAKRFSANYSDEFKDLNFASYPNQVNTEPQLTF